MKNISLILCLLLVGCFSTKIAGNEKYVAISTLSLTNAAGHEEAQAHCSQYGKSAVPRNRKIEKDVIIFDCK
ncbi:MAG: hypothetical protein GC136_07660 [Alphaproteobacteria bacterium]|nr:hypothetical protein [Alphaproteobacteria bacterium]